MLAWPDPGFRSMVESSYTIGVKKGVKQGEKQKAIKIAENLLAQGNFDPKSIAEMTELSIEEVEKLSKK